MMIHHYCQVADCILYKMYLIILLIINTYIRQNCQKLMEQFFFGPNQELDTLQHCIVHEMPCTFYHRSTGTPACEKCKEQIED